MPKPYNDLARIHRFQDVDTSQEIELELVDTGTTAADGTPIFSLGTTPSPSSSPPASPNWYNCDDSLTALTNALVNQPFGFSSCSIEIDNDELPTGASIFVSLDGGSSEHEIFPGEGLYLPGVKATGIQIRGTAGGEAYRLRAW